MLKLLCNVTLLTLLAALSLAVTTFAEGNSADYIDPVTGMEFMAIPGGSFMMGDDQDSTAQPAHTVNIEPFLIGRHEVTFGQYAKFCDSTGRPLPADEGWGMDTRPVINVSWHEAVAFTGWLSEQSGKLMRLPSESEWEYAARGGATTKYPWGDEIGENRANCNGCGSSWDNQKTAPVGKFKPNSYGLYDMIGNVYEWCLDMHHNDYHGAPIDGSAWMSSEERGLTIYRGASWYQPIKEVSVTQRCWAPSDNKDYQTGFRVVLDQ